MKHSFVVLLGFSLTACTNTITQTPAGIEIYSFGKSPQAVADEAEAHCQQYGLDAQIKAAQRNLAGEAYQDFDCVHPNPK